MRTQLCAREHERVKVIWRNTPYITGVPLAQGVGVDFQPRDIASSVPRQDRRRTLLFYLRYLANCIGITTAGALFREIGIFGPFLQTSPSKISTLSYAPIPPQTNILSSIFAILNHARGTNMDGFSTQTAFLSVVSNTHTVLEHVLLYPPIILE